MVEEVLGPQPTPLDRRFYAVPPAPGAAAASANDSELERDDSLPDAPFDVDVEEDSSGNAVQPTPTGRSSSRVRKAVAMFDPTPTKKPRVDPPPAPIPTGSLGAALTRIQTNQVGPRSYLVANEILLPIAMRDYDPDPESLLANDRTQLDAFFTRGLTDVCDSVFGPRLTKRLQVEFSRDAKKMQIRNFFEITPAGSQCTGVLSGVTTGAILEYCWICGTKTGDDGNPKECEHKFSILPALVVTGIYDTRLRKALGEKGLKVYQPQLASEYAYAHRRCNQVKTDVVFASLQYQGNNPRIVQCGTNPTAVQATLNEILTREATTYTPQPNELRAKYKVAPLWDGLSPAATDPATPDDASWITARTQRVGQSMMAAAAKFNSKRLPAFVVKTHVVNAMLTRAIELSPQLVREEMWDSLSKEGQAMVTRSLAGARGGRRKTRRSRKGTRRAMRGGDGDADIWIDIVSSIVKEARLENLATELEKAFVGVTKPEDYNARVMKVFANHVGETDRETNQIVYTMSGGTWKELIASIEYQISIPGSGPMPRAKPTAQKMEDAGPMGPGPVATAVSDDTGDGAAPSPKTPTTPPSIQTDVFEFVKEIYYKSPGPKPAPGSDVEREAIEAFAQTPEVRKQLAENPRSPLRRRGSKSGLKAPEFTSDSDNNSEQMVEEIVGDAPVGTLSQRGGFKFTLGKRPDWL